MPRSKLPPAASESASEALYATFSRYGGTHLEGCPHCVSFEESAALRRAPLRQLGGELDRYLFKAMTTWGNEEDFKHFLPRLLELHASSAHAGRLCDKLAYARWRSWVSLEQRAVESYLQARWRARLTEHGAPLPDDVLLDTLLALGIDIAPYDPRARLDGWRSDGSRESARSLARFVVEHGVELFWPDPSDGHPPLWQTRPRIAEAVRAWLLEPATRALLEASFVAHGDHEVARAFDYLEAAALEQ